MHEAEAADETGGPQLNPHPNPWTAVNNLPTGFSLSQRANQSENNIAMACHKKCKLFLITLTTCGNVINIFK